MSNAEASAAPVSDACRGALADCKGRSLFSEANSGTPNPEAMGAATRLQLYQGHKPLCHIK